MAGETWNRTFEHDFNAHEDASLMIPPPGFKFIPRFETVCGKPGCFECFDIYCERCESKDRRIVELEMRNNDLVKYIAQLQGRIFGRKTERNDTSGSPEVAQPHINSFQPLHASSPTTQPQTKTDPFAYIQSPVLYDPGLKVNYVATTTFSPASYQP